MSLEVAGGQKENIKKTEWKNETSQRQASVCEFLKNHFSQSMDSHKQYDSISELHTSGTNVDVLQKIGKGEAMVNEVSLYYENDKPKQVHIVFDSEGKGHNIDVYISGRALEDYLVSDKPQD